jgi:hypothetical protein
LTDTDPKNNISSAPISLLFLSNLILILFYEIMVTSSLNINSKTYKVASEEVFE